MQALAVEIAHDIRNQYTIAYSPTIQALDGSYRQIKVTVDAPASRSSALVRAITQPQTLKTPKSSSRASITDSSAVAQR